MYRQILISCWCDDLSNDFFLDTVQIRKRQSKLHRNFVQNGIKTSRLLLRGVKISHVCLHNSVPKAFAIYHLPFNIYLTYIARMEPRVRL